MSGDCLDDNIAYCSMGNMLLECNESLNHKNWETCTEINYNPCKQSLRGYMSVILSFRSSAIKFSSFVFFRPIT